MTNIQAIILGIIQGLTEFLPVSSSGHLVIFQSLFKNFNQPGITFDVTLHLGTLFSVLIFFYKDIVEIFKMRNIRLIILLVIATIPAGIIGILYKDKIEMLFLNIKLVGIALIFTGILLYLSDKIKRTYKDYSKINYFDALLIGIAQAFAIIPGISRSGSTISTGIFCKLKRETAVKFSFLLSIPAISGAIILSLKDISSISKNYYIPYLLGFLASMITGLCSLRFLTFLTKIKNLKIFSYYCWIVAILIFIFIR